MTSTGLKKGNTSKPKVTLIIPYNKDRGYLNDAIDSIQNQDYDGTIEIILSRSDNTVGYNINRGIEIATGQYIKYFAEDDYLEPDCVRRSVELLQSGTCLWMHGDSYIIWPDKHKTIQIPPHIQMRYEHMIKNCLIHGGTVMYDITLFKLFGLFDESLKTAEEYEFYLRLLKAGYNPGYLPGPIFNYRRHPLQKSLGNRDAEYQAWRRSVVIEIQNRHKK